MATYVHLDQEMSLPVHQAFSAKTSTARSFKLFAPLVSTVLWAPQSLNNAVQQTTALLAHRLLSPAVKKLATAYRVSIYS